MQRSHTNWHRSMAAFLGHVAGFFTGYQHHAITLLVLVYSLDFADRTLIGALGPTLKSVFSIGNFQLGLLASAFAIVSAPAALPFGVLTDRVRRTWLIGGALLVWVVAEGLVGASISFIMLLIVRVALGIVSAVAGPTSPSMIGDLVPADERSGALSVIDGGELIGDGVGFVLPAILLGFISWRWNFWVLAACGLILSFAFLRLPEPRRTNADGPASNDVTPAPDGQDHQDDQRAGDPQQPRQGTSHPQADDGHHNTRESPSATTLTPAQHIIAGRKVRPRESAMVRENPGRASFWYAIKYTFRVRTDLIVLISRMVGDFFLTAIGTFAVVFATAWYHLTEREAEVLILVIGIGALAGILVVGKLSDFLLDRGHPRSRIILGTLGYLVAPVPLYFAFSTHTLLLAVVLFFVGAFLLGGSSPPLDAVRIDVLVPRLRGRAESVRQFTRTLAEAGAPLLLGWLSGVLAANSSLGLERAFLLGLPLVLVGGIILIFAIFTYQGDVAAALASNQGLRADDRGDDRGDDWGDDREDDSEQSRPQPAANAPIG